MAVKTTKLRRVFKRRSSLCNNNNSSPNSSLKSKIASSCNQAHLSRRATITTTMDFEHTQRQQDQQQQHEQMPRRRSSFGSVGSNNHQPRQRRRSSLDNMSMTNSATQIQVDTQQLRRGSSAGTGIPSRDRASNGEHMSSYNGNGNVDTSINGRSSSGRSSNNPRFRPPTTASDDHEPLGSHHSMNSSNLSGGPTSNGNITSNGHGGGAPSSNPNNGPNRRTSMSDIEQAERRASIKQIMQDGRLSQLEKRRSIQFLMDGRRSTIDCGQTNPYLQAKAAAMEKMKRDSITRSSSFDNGDGESVASAAARSRRSSIASQSSMDMAQSNGNGNANFAATSRMNGTHGGDLPNYYAHGHHGHSGGGDDDVLMMDSDELDSRPPVFRTARPSEPTSSWEAFNASAFGNGNGGGSSPPPSSAREAAAAWSSYHKRHQQEEEHIEIPDHNPMAAAAIAHASAQTTSDLLAAKHPYKATTTAVPAVAAQASEAHPYNMTKMSGGSPLHSSFNSGLRRPSASVEVSRRAIETAPPCTHYDRKCHIISPCCGATFGCRICHDDCPVLPPLLAQQGMGMGMMGGDMMDPNVMGGGGRKFQRMQRTSSMPSSFSAEVVPEHHNVDRFAIAEVICRECFTKQSSKTNFCVNCNVQFGEYHCAICNLWMSNEERPYHCPDCGFCRVGGGENFSHCQDCGMCIDKQLFKDHNCKVGKYMSNCPVCQEDLFSSRDASHELPCGHAIHWHCFRELASHDSRCPMCKKTAETHERMKPTWDAMAMGIALQPVPPELCKVVTIKCNDCEEIQQNRAWHFLGVQCKHCESFNTVVERITMMGQEAHEFLLREDPHPSTAAGANNSGANNGTSPGNAAGGAQQQRQQSSTRARGGTQRPRRRRATVAVESSNQAPPPPFNQR